MKRIIAIFVLLFTVIGLASCATKVEGKTYAYEKFEYELTEGLTKIEEGIAEAAVTAVKIIHEGKEITFNANGTCTFGQWTQDGKDVTIGSSVYKATGNKLVLEVTTEDYTYKVTYKIKK